MFSMSDVIIPDDFNDAIVVLPLSNSPEICLINYSDYEQCIKYNWRLFPTGIYTHIKHRTVSLILFLTKRKFSDHKDRNILNNTRLNFRYATPSQQACNRVYKITKRFKNVRFHKPNGTYQAIVQKDGICHSGGYFKDEIDAAKAANELLVKLHGEFAILNSI